MRIRPMTAEDLPAVAEIWNRVIRETTMTFTTEEKTVEGLGRWLGAGGPRLVAEAGGVAGFVSADQFRNGPGYIHCFEHTVYVAEGLRGGGAGRALMAAIEEAARDAGGHSLVGGISGENEGAVAFHRRLGYAEAGRVREAGRKFGRWLDLVLMQKML